MQYNLKFFYVKYNNVNKIIKIQHTEFLVFRSNFRILMTNFYYYIFQFSAQAVQFIEPDQVIENPEPD
jgi:hypothetical protein